MPPSDDRKGLTIPAYLVGAIVSVSVQLASLAFAWGVMTQRVDATEARVDRREVEVNNTLNRLEARIDRLEDRLLLLEQSR